MSKLLPVLLIAAMLSGCAVAPQDGSAPSVSMFGAMTKPMAPPPAPATAPAPSPRGDIRIMNSFRPGASTVTDAVRILGVPTLVNNSPDGRFVYMYDFPSTPQGPLLAGMLFGPDQVLIRIDYFPGKK